MEFFIIKIPRVLYTKSFIYGASSLVLSNFVKLFNYPVFNIRLNTSLTIA